MDIGRSARRVGAGQVGEPPELDLGSVDPAADQPGSEDPLADEPAGDGRSSDPALRPARRPRRGTGSRRRTVTALAWAAAILVGGGLATWGAVQLERARTAQDLADLGLAITADPQAKHATAQVGTGGSVTLVVSGTRAALVARDLLVLDSQHAYQVWLVRDNLVSPVALGPSGASGGAPWVRVVTGVQPGDTIAVSQEPAQGSTRPSGKPIAALKL
jgi:hypothetical protein